MGEKKEWDPDFRVIEVKSDMDMPAVDSFLQHSGYPPHSEVESLSKCLHRASISHGYIPYLPYPTYVPYLIPGIWTLIESFCA